MKLRKNWKRFWTLDRHHAEGFTLVELIVVIAILAILGGVAVPAYSGYVKKANIAADTSLLSDVHQALELGAYSGMIEGYGYVVLTDTGMAGSSDAINAALKAVFGDSYAANKLITDGHWSAIFNGTQGEAQAVINSSYVTGAGTDKLMEDVQGCTSALSGLLQGLYGSSAEAANTLKSLMGATDAEGNNVINNILANAGYKDEEDYNSVDMGTFTNVLANATVFGVADYVTANESDVVSGISSGDILNSGPLTANIYEAASWYASLEALVEYMDDSSCTAAFESIDMKAADGTSVVASMNEAYSQIGVLIINNPELEEKWASYYESDTGNGKTQAAIDAEAYAAMLKTVDQQYDSGNFNDAESLGDKGLMTGSGVSNALNSYVNGAQAVAGTSGANADLNTVLSKLDSYSFYYPVYITISENGAPEITPALSE